MVGFREASVNNHQFAVCLDWVLTLGSSHRYVTINDMAVRTGYPKRIHNIVDILFVIAQQELVSLLFFMRLLISNEIALKGCHLTLVEERTVWTAPEIDEIIDSIFFLIRI